MTTCRGSLSFEGDAASPVSCAITVGSGRMVLAVSGQSIGDWDLGEMALSRTPEGFRIEVEGESLLLATDQADALAAALGMASPEEPLPPEGPRSTEASEGMASPDMQSPSRSAWWHFWEVSEWKNWWRRRQEWREYQKQRRALNRLVTSTQGSLTAADTRLAAAEQGRTWAEQVGPRHVPLNTAKDENGLATVEGVTLLETRKREGKDVWTEVDRGTVHFTDRKAVFVGSKKNVEFRYGKLTATELSPQGLLLAVSTRKRSHILVGPSDRLHATLVASQAVAAGTSPTAPFDADLAKWSIERERHQEQLTSLRFRLSQLRTPRRPISPAWIPASVLLLLMFVGGALASPGSSPLTAAGTTTSTTGVSATPGVSVVPVAPGATATTTITSTAAEEDEHSGTTTTSGTRATGDLTVWFFDVGQGDSTLLQSPDFTILIDAGRHDRSDVVPHLLAAGVTQIDLLVGTHPHADHIGQFPQVLREFPVAEVWMSGDNHNTLTYERALDAILASDAGYLEPRAGETHRIGSAQIEVINPDRITGDLHDGSVSLRVVFGQVAFMFTGDAEAATEAAMVRRGHDLQAQVLQVGHHGSRTSSSIVFLDAVNPVVAVYSAGANNQYGHPHSEAVDRLVSAGAMVYGTDVNGVVRVVTNGISFGVDVEREGAIAATTTTIAAAATTAPAASIGCSPGQVDINTAGVEDLQLIIHIGPARAEEMLTLRPFRSVDEMNRINGIGPARLADIKAQGVACVP